MSAFEDWLLDGSRNDHRVLLVELDHATDFVRAGHGRRNSQENLNEPFKLEVFTYGPNDPTFGELTFRQPVTHTQYNYYTEIWIDGVIVSEQQAGDYQFTKTAGSTVQVAVASAKAGGRYSKPIVASIVMNGTVQTVKGLVGDWEEVGDGAGIGGTGTTYLSSRPWLDPETNAQYDDWLLPGLSVEENLDGALGVGDIDVVHPDPDNEIDFLNRRWRGYECRMFYGDIDWTKSDFHQIATPMIDNCRQIGSSLYRFDTIESDRKLRRTFLTADLTLTGSITNAIDTCMTQAGLSTPTYRNLGTRGGWLVHLEMTSSTRLDNTVRKLAASMGAYVRVRQTGEVEVFRPDTVAEPLTLTEDDIAYGGVRMIDVTHAYERVQVNMSENGPRSSGTPALTGGLSETYELDTFLRVENEADVLVTDLVDYYTFGHAEWEIAMLNVSEIEIGARVAVEHEDLTGEGLVTRVIRAPLSTFSRIVLTV